MGIIVRIVSFTVICLFLVDILVTFIYENKCKKNVYIRNQDFFTMSNSGPDPCAETSPINVKHKCNNFNWILKG